MTNPNLSRFDAHRNFYVDEIIRHLRTFRYMDLAPEDILVRVVFRDMADFHRDSELDVGDFAKDMLVDNVRYIDDTSFLLTLSESNFNFDTYDLDKDDGEPLARIPGTRHTIVVRRNSGTAAPYISAYFLHPVKRIIERTVKLISGELSAVGMKPFELEELENDSFIEEMETFFHLRRRKGLLSSRFANREAAGFGRVSVCRQGIHSTTPVSGWLCRHSAKAL